MFFFLCPDSLDEIELGDPLRNKRTMLKLRKSELRTATDRVDEE